MSFHRPALALIGYFLSMIVAVSTDLFVSPMGTSFGNGRRENPLNLTTALSFYSPAQPGDTIWLRGGRYIGKFVSELNGTESQPITVRSYPGEWAVIDSGISENRRIILQIIGSWTIFRDFEVMSSDPVRHTDISGSYPIDVRRGEGIQVRGPHTKLVNLVIHDTAQGVAAWTEAPDSEIYGCLIYYNGWQGPDRAHGHGIYSQNRDGTRLIRDNIIFSQFEKGIQIYGSERAFIRNHVVEGNIVFNNGVLSQEQNLSENLTLYGGTGPEGCVIQDNLFYGTAFQGKLLVGGAGAKDLVFQNNYVPHLTRIRNWQSATVTGNTFATDSTMLEYYFDALDPRSAYVWDRNAYFDREVRYSPFGVIERTSSGSMLSAGLSFESWKYATGFDLSSTYVRAVPTGAKVVVRPNAYEKGRAHIAVYNWNHLPSVDVDLNSVLVAGQPFEIYDAQNYFGNPVVSGIFEGDPIPLTVTGLEAVPPIGVDVPFQTAPEFNAYILISAPAPVAIAPVNSPPAISAFQDQSTAQNTATAPIPFGIGDLETPAAKLGVIASSSNPELVPNANIRLEGSDSSRTITLMPASNQSGSTTISVSVNDGFAVTVRSFSLTVEAQSPALTTHSSDTTPSAPVVQTSVPENHRPIISSIPNQLTYDSAPTSAILLMVVDSETPSENLTVAARSADPSLVPSENIAFSGTGSLRSIQITPAKQQYGTTTIHVTVSDGIASTETSFVFTASN